MKKVLIAHQSSIPHYRVPFFNALEHLRPDSWRFDVVFDTKEREAKRFFKVDIDTEQFAFPILDTRTFPLPLPGNQVVYQAFFWKARQYDLIIVSSRLTNLTYFLCKLYQITGRKLAYWGHGQDRMVPNPTGFKLALEKLRIWLAKSSNGFFAYTPGVKSYLENQGVPANKIYALNNTIDIKKERELYKKWHSRKKEIKKDLGLQDKKVLLYVGQFNERKRINFLFESISVLQKNDPDFHLLMVGSKSEAYQSHKPDNVSILGVITDKDKLASLYIASEIYTFPGAIGLGPLQALCYDLPVLWIDAPNHTPEVEYLSPLNSIMLETCTTPEKYAQTIIDLCKDPSQLKSLRAKIWPSIEHLTVEKMVENFIAGVNAILGL